MVILSSKMTTHGFASDVLVSVERTPNPGSVKFSVGRELHGDCPLDLRSREEAQAKSPLAERLFAEPGVVGVLIGHDFVTVSRGEHGDGWSPSELAGPLRVIEAYLGESRAAVHPADARVDRTSRSIPDRIQEFLDREIRGAAALDGGDIQLDRFEGGVAWLRLTGACRGCPQSKDTLGEVVVRRLQGAVPEVESIQVVADSTPVLAL